jgi:hypothetical protein
VTYERVGDDGGADRVYRGPGAEARMFDPRSNRAKRKRLGIRSVRNADLAQYCGSS